MVSVAYGLRRVQGGMMRGINPPTSHFQNVFDVYNFAIISNFFGSNLPYALSMYIRKCANKKCIIFGEALKIRAKQFKQNFPKNYSQSTKIAITACKLSKYFPDSMPQDSLDLFLFLNQLQICSAEKITSKKCGNFGPPF